MDLFEANASSKVDIQDQSLSSCNCENQIADILYLPGTNH